LLITGGATSRARDRAASFFKCNFSIKESSKLFGLKKLIKVGRMHWYYLIGALLILVTYAYLKDYIQTDEALVSKGNPPSYWPHGFPNFFQNMFYGPFSDFGIYI
jgi:hypothetical protein